MKHFLLLLSIIIFFNPIQLCGARQSQIFDTLSRPHFQKKLPQKWKIWKFEKNFPNALISAEHPEGDVYLLHTADLSGLKFNEDALIRAALAPYGVDLDDEELKRQIVKVKGQ